MPTSPLHCGRQLRERSGVKIGSCELVPGLLGTPRGLHSSPSIRGAGIGMSYSSKRLNEMFPNSAPSLAGFFVFSRNIGGRSEFSRRPTEGKE